MKIYCAAVIVFLLSTMSHAQKIALTFDDAPLGGSALMSGEEKTRKIIDALKKNNVEDALFFVTTSNIQGQEGKHRLVEYTNAGFHLGHHSHEHKSANNIGAENYLEDFYKAQLLLSKYDNVLKYHRFPYLHYGATKHDRKKILNGLKKQDYKIGYVTVDNYDWYLNSKLIAAYESGKTIDYNQLRKLYVDLMWQSITFYNQLGQEVLGTSPAHVLLLHENELSALYIGDLIKHIRAQGWEIITPEAAYSDPISTAYTSDFQFNKQGRIAALAHHKGIDEKRLRHESENESYIDKKLGEYQVLK